MASISRGNVVQTPFLILLDSLKPSFVGPEKTPFPGPSTLETGQHFGGYGSAWKQPERRRLAKRSGQPGDGLPGCPSGPEARWENHWGPKGRITPVRWTPTLGQFFAVSWLRKFPKVCHYFQDIKHDFLPGKLNLPWRYGEMCHAKFLSIKEIQKLRHLSSFWGPPQVFKKCREFRNFSDFLSEGVNGNNLEHLRKRN